jgi:hypothetical protein
MPALPDFLEDRLKAVKPLGAHGLGSFGGHSACKQSRPLQ